jgi:Fe-S oxidoreductase
VISIDAATGATDREMVFAGGGTRSSGDYSPVNETLQGRKGALSIERFIQNANMGAGRENDGPFQTRLFTSLTGIDPLPRTRPTDEIAGYTTDEARAEAGRCIQCECLECVKVCLYLERYQGYPKKYARQVFNNERVILGAAHNKNQFVNSCSTCGLCETVCPNNFNMGDLTLQARRTMNEQQLMPLSFHEFALRDMAHSNGERFALSRHEPGRSESAWLYFPSCQLCATSPGEVLTSYRFLRERLVGGVGIMLRCCGAPAWWAGREELFRESLAAIRDGWESLGKPRVITACVTCGNLFTEHLPELSARPVWELLEEIGLPASLAKAEAGQTVAVIDPCAARHDPAARESARRTIAALGLTVEELPLSGDHPECCGYGGLMFNANPGLARDVITRRVTASDRDYLAYCAMCRDNFAAAGKRASHLIEHIFPSVTGGDPAARVWLSWTERRENRTKVRREILRERGEEGGDSMIIHDELTIHMTAEVRRKIDERRILENDLRQVIDHAQRTGRRLLNSGTGQYRASCQTENVTFWVDYIPEDGGFTVHNAYCHRMKIVGVK